MSAGLEPYRSSYPCRVCAAPAAEARVWLDTPLGLCCWHTCAGSCEERAVELEREQPARRVPEPLTREERAAVRAEREEAEHAARVELAHEAAVQAASPHPADF